MKQTNGQKGNNSAIQTGVRVLQNKLLKLGEDITHEEETIRLNRNIANTELGNARILVATQRLLILNGMVKQLNKCISMLEENLV